MTGYVRADVSNNISNGATANADDLDLEFDALQSAFNTTVGHSHNGATGEGAPITVIGPVQDFVATGNSLSPKNTSQYDLGTSGFRYRDAWFSRNLVVGGNLTLTGNFSVSGTFSISGNAVTSTAAELNILDGVTATTAEINTMDGITATTAELNIMDGVTATTAEINILDGLTATTADLNILDGNLITTTELNALVGVSSNIQAQINALIAGVFSVTGAATTIIDDDLTASRVLVSNGSGKVAVSTLSSADLPKIANLNNIGSPGTVPVGGIILWSGSIAAIPAGWALCNGSNGTPNLVDRFVVGAGSLYAVGATGGATSVALSAANIPAHTHTFSGATTVNGNHIHVPLNGNAFLTNTTSGAQGSFNYGSGSAVFTGLVFQTTADGDHQHFFSGTTSSVGSGTGFSILPPYYALAFIMKL